MAQARAELMVQQTLEANASKATVQSTKRYNRHVSLEKRRPEADRGASQAIGIYSTYIQGGSGGTPKRGKRRKYLPGNATEVRNFLSNEIQAKIDIRNDNMITKYQALREFYQNKTDKILAQH